MFFEKVILFRVTRLSGAMVKMFAPSEIKRGFDPRSSQAHDIAELVNCLSIMSCLPADRCFIHLI